jgi:hypothetical protein
MIHDGLVGVTNCVSWPPLTGSSTVVGSLSSPQYKYQIRKVENGYIVTRYSREFVFSDLKDLHKWMTEEEKAK